jgi:thiol:disulfide interchange protein DsbD
MKKVMLLSFLIAVVAGASLAQPNPVKWSFSASKISDKIFEVKMVATIQKNWHLYSQVQPENAIAIPTTFTFNPNPLFELEGKVKEIGKLEKFTDKTLGVSANQYSNTVVFTQKVKLKSKIKTSLTGSVEYQTCDDEKCLPPKTVPFTVSLK